MVQVKPERSILIKVKFNELKTKFGGADWVMFEKCWLWDTYMSTRHQGRYDERSLNFRSGIQRKSWMGI